ncbi:MAG TPA: energy-coupling factor transporter transmembrane component T [Solirubrobacteraceae bacterium]|nr:energy-coupling factor transporter transmembrane component T [Solirubrobacteraceae bacterium]
MRQMGGAGRIAYRRLASPLHAARAPVAACYGAALATAALIVEHPLLLVALLLAVLAAGTAAGVGPQLRRAARTMALPILALTVIVNVLVSREGLTVFARLGDWGVLGQVNLTVEAVVYGLVFGLRMLVVTLACMLVICAANPDELLLAFRRISPRSALTATLTTRLIPVLGEDARRLAEAQRCRPDRGARGARGRLAILRATVGGALERSLDVAAVLEMRGYGSAGRAPAAGRASSRHDLSFALAAAGLLAVSAVVAGGDLAPFHAYPLISVALTPATFMIAAVLLGLALVPFLDRRGIEP